MQQLIPWFSENAQYIHWSMDEKLKTYLTYITRVTLVVTNFTSASQIMTTNNPLYHTEFRNPMFNINILALQYLYLSYME